MENIITIQELLVYCQVARFLMKTISQLGSGKQPVGTIAYMGKIQYLMQCKCDVLTGQHSTIFFQDKNLANKTTRCNLCVLYSSLASGKPFKKNVLDLMWFAQ